MVQNGKENKLTFLNHLQRACCIFTPCIILFYALGLLISSEKRFIPSFPTVCIIFAFSFIISVTASLYRKMAFAAAHLINFFIIGATYYIAVIAFRGLASNGIQTLIAMCIYVVLFAVATVIVTVLKGRKKTLINDVKPYESKFD